MDPVCVAGSQQEQEKLFRMDEKNTSRLSTSVEESNAGALHFARRGEAVDEQDVSSVESDIVGFDAARMKARSLLTEVEEKRLMRRIDWHLMPLCSIMFCTYTRTYSTPMSQSSKVSTASLWSYRDPTFSNSC